MTDAQRKKAAKAFCEYWLNRGDEKSDSQSFWLSFIRDVLGVDEPEKYIIFEERVKLDHTSFIDGHIPSTHVLIEQKKKGLNLRSPIKQSDGSLLTPFQQAQKYSAGLPYSQRPRWIITCNFDEFLIYDMEKPTGEPESILLKDLEKEYYRFQFLVEQKNEILQKEEQASIQAGELVGKLYDAILKQYIHPDDQSSLHSLNILCVRLVFCLYAEDSGIFGEHNKFNHYVRKVADNDIDDVREALIKLFRVLDTPYDKRSDYLKAELASFPYVNGGLFADENIEIPNFTQEIVDILLRKASAGFDWSSISPTIFGAVFESTLNPETRRSGGMHYTSIENIHKLINPLFLDDLLEEFAEIKQIKIQKTRKEKAEAFRNKLASLTFLDPACGSGNFLTETYISLRRLENEALKLINEDQIVLGFDDIIKVSIGQFYGIEINDFAVTVAKTALWIAESQMMKETEQIIDANLDFLPLKSYANIVEGNALRIDWETVVPKEKLNYIMGNPPFSGFKMQTTSQRDDMKLLAGKEIDRIGLLDYVCGWYILAAKFIENTNIRCAYVSTNSISQGEQPSILWEFMFNHNIEINFAHRTFVWSSESKKSASVHCVIIGFSAKRINSQKLLFESDRPTIVENICPYLVSGPNIVVRSQKNPLCKVPKMIAGNKTVKCLALIMNESEKNELIAKEPQAAKYIKRMIGAEEFINNIPRFCLWLVGVSPAELRKMPFVMKRVEQVRADRLASADKQAHVLANTPTTFRDTNNPAKAIVVPLVSSERRKYIPMGYIDDSTIANNKVSIIPDGTIYQFGILTSNVHNAWMRCVAMRMKSDYSYSLQIVYNTFPWPSPSDEQKKKIEETAQAILDARALYPDSSLADLYDELTMPVELRKAHQANDKVVMQAYGFWGKLNSESECVAELMKMYQELTK